MIDGHPFSFERREYLREPYHDDHPFQVVQKATQVGESIRAILRAFYTALYREAFRNILYYFPTDNDVTRFSRGRINPLITENHQEIGQYIGQTDSANIKKLLDSFVYFLGMRSIMQVKSVPGNAILMDEFDESTQLSYDKAMERLGGEMDEENIFVHLLSNPTLPDFGVSREFEFTDQKYWLLKCPGCGSHINLEFAFMDWVKEQGPPVLLPVNGTYIRACTKCQRELDPSQGEWVALKNNAPDKRGYHFTQLWSQTWLHRPDAIMDKYRRAQKTGNLQDFFNLVIGFGYVEAENRLTVEEVLELCGSQGIETSSKTPCLMGVDQGKNFHVVVGRGLGGTFVEIIHVGEYTAWEQIETLMRDFNVMRCVVDGGPDPHGPVKLAEAFPGKVWRHFYDWHRKGSYAWNEQENMVTTNRTESLNASHEVIRQKLVVLPKLCGETKVFAEQCHNIAKKLQEEEIIDKKTGQKVKTGKKVWVYLPLGSGEDHYRHAFNYFCVAWSEAAKGLFWGKEI